MLCGVLTVCAEEEDAFSQTVPGEFSELLGKLPEELAEMLPPELFSDDSTEVGGAVREMSDFSYLLQSFLSAIGIHLRDAIGLLATVIGVLLISSVFAALRSTFQNESISKAFALCSSLVTVALLLSKGFASIQAVVNYFHTLNTLTGVSIPLLGALYAMGGNVTTAAASAGGLTIYMTVLEEIVGQSIVPFCGACLALSVIGTPEFGVRLGSLLSNLKKQYATLLGFLMMLLIAMLSTQTVLSARADTLAMRSVKFAAGNLIPVVGGSVSELIRTVSAGVGYLRGTLGICGTILILLLLFPPLAELLLYRLVFQISASLADMLGCDTEKRLLDEIASLNGYLITAVCICSSVLLLSFTLLVRCSSAIG